MPPERLDVRLARETGLTRSRVEALIREGRAQVSGKVETKPGAKVSEIAAVTLDVPPPAPLTAQPEALPLDILYEDECMAVIDKPCGMVVHPAAGNETGTLVNALLHHLSGLSGIGGALRPGIVHRLDKDTSGLLLVAKTDEAHQKLSAMLAAREIEKTYMAVASGHFKEETGAVEAPIARHPLDRKKMAVVNGGRWARTEYQVALDLKAASLLRVKLITGRTHQIRVHMAHIGHPLVGDLVYAGKKPAVTANRLLLHAWRLRLNHPITGAPLCFEAPPPESFQKAVVAFLPEACQKDTAWRALSGENYGCGTTP